MEIVGTATKVTIYVGESDRWGQKSLYMAILEMLKAEDCAGATVDVRPGQLRRAQPHPHRQHRRSVIRSAFGHRMGG